MTEVAEIPQGAKTSSVTDQSKEILLAREQQVSRIVSSVETLFAKREMLRQPGERKMLCGLAAELTARAGERMGGFNVGKYQLMNIHKELGAADATDVFQHGITVLQSQVDLTDVFIGDVSFCQFMDPTTGEIRQLQANSNIQYSDNPLAQELLNKGYFKLTDESLKEYLNISSAAPDKTYIQTATVNQLLSIDPGKISLPLEHEVDYLDKLLDGENTFR